MEVKDEFKEMVKEIQESGKSFKITSRQLVNYFYCEKRTKWNIARINEYLEENKLETTPDYINGWIDAEIIIKHKKKATSKIEKDPIQRIKILQSANKQPITINNDSSLKEAITLMMMHNYSQLPVVGGPKSIVGFVSWETIGRNLASGNTSAQVKDYMSKDIAILPYETPLLDAIRTIIEKEFVIVQKHDKSISGIVTIADISAQFLTLTEPFLLLEQIEQNVRLLLDGKLLVEQLRTFCNQENGDKDIEFIDDLTFGDYVRIIENPDFWDELKLPFDRAYLKKQLDEIRKIRNDIMHFDPEGITEDQRSDLLNMANFLMNLRAMHKED